MYPYLSTHSHESTTFTLSNQEISQRFDKRTFLTKKKDILLSIAREALFIFKAIWYRLTFKEQPFHQLNQKITWKTNSQGLIVLLNGLSGHPGDLTDHSNDLKHHNTIDLFVPPIPKKGYCTLKEATQPLFKQILDYARLHPTRPICLIGFSNGGRLATDIDLMLRKESPTTPVKVSTVAAVHYGSSMINHLNRLYLANLIVTKPITEELAFGSQQAQNILKELSEPLQPGMVRDYEFIATTEDTLVPLTSSLPQIGHGAKHIVMHGHAHCHLIKAAWPTQKASCFSFIKSTNEAA